MVASQSRREALKAIARGETAFFTPTLANKVLSGSTKESRVRVFLARLRRAAPGSRRFGDRRRAAARAADRMNARSRGLGESTMQHLARARRVPLSLPMCAGAHYIRGMRASPCPCHPLGRCKRCGGPFSKAHPARCAFFIWSPECCETNEESTKTPDVSRNAKQSYVMPIGKPGAHHAEDRRQHIDRPSPPLSAAGKARRMGNSRGEGSSVARR